jgi:hypothetical protein
MHVLALNGRMNIPNAATVHTTYSAASDAYLWVQSGSLYASQSGG